MRGSVHRNFSKVLFRFLQRSSSECSSKVLLKIRVLPNRGQRTLCDTKVVSMSPSSINETRFNVTITLPSPMVPDKEPVVLIIFTSPTNLHRD